MRYDKYDDTTKTNKLYFWWYYLHMLYELKFQSDCLRQVKKEHTLSFK